MTVSASLIHALIVALAIAAYVVLTVTGHDGNPVFVFIGGQGVGAVTQLVTAPKTVQIPTPVIAPDRSTLKESS